jgi:phage-related protein
VGEKNNMAKLEPVQLDIITKSSGKGLQDTEKQLTGFGGTMQKIGTIAAGMGLANLGSQMVGNLKQFLGESSQAANDLAKAMTTLDIIAPRFGESGAKAQESAKALGEELRIGTGAAAEGLQNLLKSGLDLDTAGELMRRFTNEAITGKSSSISLGQAVQNLSFAYATNNSALGNLSGVSENFSDIIKKGEEALLKEGVAAGDITEDMAKLKGMMDLTNLTMGSAERFTGTLIDKQAQLDIEMTKLKETIGNGLNVVMAQLYGFLLDSGAIEKFTEGLQKIGTFIVENKEPFIAFTIGALIPMGIALATVVVPAIWAAVTGMIAFLAPFVLIGAAVAALYLIWTNNFLGIRDIVLGVVDWFNTYVLPTLTNVFNWIGSVLMTLWQIFQNVWNFLIKPLLGAFVTYLRNTFWLPIKNVFDLMTVALEKMGLTWGDVWNGVKTVVFGILSAIVNEVKRRVNDIINVINGMISGANSIGSNVPGYTKINTIPNLANGTDSFSGGMARVGEQGPENVYLPPGSRVTPYSPNGGGERPIEVTQIINSGVDMDFAFRELAYVLRTN